MSADRITRVTQRSYGNRIGQSFGGVVIGGILFLVSFPLLFWNEGRAVRTYQALKEGAGAVVSVPAAPVDPAHEGRLVHVTGRAETLETISDPVFGVSAAALKLRRAVEMFQWVEKKSSHTRTKLGGGEETVTTYTYEKTWKDEVVRSSSFEEPAGHQNPGQTAFPDHHVNAGRVTVGDFTLSSSLLDLLDRYQDLPPPADHVLPAALSGRVTRTDDGFYVGRDPARPEVGDLRIRFDFVPPQEISLVARQTGSTFAPYPTKAGQSVELLQCGTVTAAEMFQHAQDTNRMITWLVRLGGFLLMLIGLAMVLGPLAVLASFIPLLGRLVGAGTGLVAGVLAAALSLVTIGVAWLTYRPLLGGGLLAGAVVVLFLLRGRARRPA